jgi:hypothetical protein
MEHVMHGAALDRLIALAISVEGAAALAAYGSTATRTWTAFSDLDLILWIEGDVRVNSVHFTFEGIPVDLNLKSLATWRSGNTGWLPPTTLSPLWDPQGIVPTTPPPVQVSTADMSQFRYAHAHRLLKLQQVVGTDDEIATFLAAGATHWIAVSWCHARGQRFPGIDQLVSEWRQVDPEMIDWLLDALQNSERRLDGIRQASARALEPVGGLLRPEEVYLTGLQATLTESDRVQTMTRLARLFEG